MVFGSLAASGSDPGTSTVTPHQHVRGDVAPDSVENSRGPGTAFHRLDAKIDFANGELPIKQKPAERITCGWRCCAGASAPNSAKQPFRARRTDTATMATATDPPKTLSTSTLSLRFMQNAHRARNLAAVQLDRAAVKDDGEWEVAQEIRDAWGAETPAPAQAVSYEASYMPFLFDTAAPSAAAVVHEGHAPIAKGRRAFKRGQEVADDSVVADAGAGAAAASGSNSVPPPPPRGAGKLRQISSQGGGSGVKKEKDKGNGKVKTKSARDAVYNSAGASVGVDLRAQKQKQMQTPEAESGLPPSTDGSVPSAAAPVFLKPAGVDAPPPRMNRVADTDSGLDPAPETRTLTRASAGKREREVKEGMDGESPAKRKKKKKEKKDAERRPLVRAAAFEAYDLAHPAVYRRLN
ncbi:hypothetical protein GGX14DRAFT_699612 [Mycena pura]|uniref:Uncharacterized protein n=1 Tax=Mycena pura TaxID=153505 RepID=A0AAD6V1I8_9AGAR|nr:hypothetical protein GGX14DRAFT_699612 [Mycena pura]